MSLGTGLGRCRSQSPTVREKDKIILSLLASLGRQGLPRGSRLCPNRLLLHMPSWLPVRPPATPPGASQKHTSVGSRSHAGEQRDSRSDSRGAGWSYRTPALLARDWPATASVTSPAWRGPGRGLPAALPRPLWLAPPCSSGNYRPSVVSGASSVYHLLLRSPVLPAGTGLSQEPPPGRAGQTPPLAADWGQHVLKSKTHV